MKEKPSCIVIEVNSYNVKEQKRIERIVDAVQHKFGPIAAESKKTEYIDALLNRKIQANNSKNNIDSVLVLRKNPGEFIKKCPGTPDYVCCNYWVINLYINCPLACQYCFLQFYLPHRHMVIHINLEDMFQEFHDKYKKYAITRIGTGELSDSLYFDDITSFSQELIEFFSLYPDCDFEFKTKTDTVENLQNFAKNQHNIVAGFSLNPANIIKTVEPKTASLHNRIHSAQILIQKGYKVSFHFDPIIAVNDFLSSYTELFSTVLQLFEDHDIAWISLGTLRYHPSMREKIRNNFPNESITKSETILGLDGKIRYFSNFRITIYKTLFSLYKSANRSFPLYLCMESTKIWDALKSSDLLPIDNLKKIFSVKKKDENDTRSLGNS